jgi:hypothetical protein
VRRSLLALVLLGCVTACSGGDHETFRQVVDRTLAATTMHLEVTSEGQKSGDTQGGAVDYQAPDRSQFYDPDGAVTAVGIGGRTYVSFCGRWATSTKPAAIGQAAPTSLLRLLASSPARRTTGGFSIDVGNTGAVKVTVAGGRVRTITMPAGDGTVVTYRYSKFDEPIPPITAPPAKYVDEAGKDGQLRLPELGFTLEAGEGVSCAPGTGTPDPQLFAPKPVG